MLVTSYKLAPAGCLLDRMVFEKNNNIIILHFVPLLVVIGLLILISWGGHYIRPDIPVNFIISSAFFLCIGSVMAHLYIHFNHVYKSVNELKFSNGKFSLVKNDKSIEFDINDIDELILIETPNHAKNRGFASSGEMYYYYDLKIKSKRYYISSLLLLNEKPFDTLGINYSKMTTIFTIITPRLTPKDVQRKNSSSKIALESKNEKKMREKNLLELQNIINHKEKYVDGVVKAAIKEIERRNG